MPTTPTFPDVPGDGYRHPCHDHQPGATDLATLLEITKVAAIFDMSPGDVVTLLVHGIDGPGAAVPVSEGFRTVTGDDPANTQQAAYRIATTAALVGWGRLASGHPS
jgi:hypothetical protein